MVGLTAIQAAYLDYIKRTIITEQRAPTIRELMARFNVKSTNAVSDHLRALQRKGFLVVDALRTRSLRIVGDELMWRGMETDRPMREADAICARCTYTFTVVHEKPQYMVALCEAHNVNVINVMRRHLNPGAKDHE